MTALANVSEIISLQVYLKNYKDYKSNIHLKHSLQTQTYYQYSPFLIFLDQTQTLVNY